MQAAPFSISTLGSPIKAKVIAINAYGESESSEVGGGALMVLVPDPPMNLLNNPLVTLDDRSGLIWNDGLSNGGQQIIDYGIYFD